MDLPHDNRHIEAVGDDVAGRRQYLHHTDWRSKRDAMKFDRVAEVVRKAPKHERRSSSTSPSTGCP